MFIDSILFSNNSTLAPLPGPYRFTSTCNSSINDLSRSMSHPYLSRTYR